MNIKIVYVFAPIFFKHERTCLLHRMQNSFSDLVGDQAHQTGSGRTALFSCCSLGPLRVLWGTRGGGHKLPSLLWQWTELVTVYLILPPRTLQVMTDVNSLKLRTMCYEIDCQIQWKTSSIGAKLFRFTGCEVQVCWEVEPEIQWTLCGRKKICAFLSGTSSSLTSVYYLHL